jgi:hypothetical protein
MSNNIEWAHAEDNAFRLVEGDEDAGNGQTPNSDEELTGNVALVIDGCALYGQPAHLLELLADGVSKLSAHLAGQQ